jgi:CubicO group peptidase (beta-lactamase class C family)
MSFLRSILLALAICATLSPPLAQAQAPQTAAPASADLESIVRAAYPADAPGAAVIVVLKGKILYRGALGLANMELGAPLHPDSVFRIGSVTKQFTAAAVLLLAEEGKLSLSDPITKFLPDYPVQGHPVTIQHLLAHTSGIRNYTELPEWQSTLRNDVSVQQLIDVFKDKPFDFAPGEHWKYDNSGYILLGAIIEKISGQSYAEFLRTHLFEPLGMQSSRYEDLAKITPGRVAGYMRDNTGWRNADYLSMSQPYSAGALLSTVDDLARWNAAIEKGELLKPASWQRACSSFALNDGTSTRYGAGWIIGRIGPVATVEHGGGINGFNAYVLRAPAQQLYIAVLANASPPPTPPQEVAVKLAARALQVPLDAPEIPIPPARLDEYVGKYLIEGTKTCVITRDGAHLYAKEGDADRLELTPVGKDAFEVRANQARFQFQREHGRIVALEMQPRILMGDRGRRVDAPVTSGRR